MVGLPCDSITTPVAFAHKSMRQSGATVAGVLSTLTFPPLSSIPSISDPSVSAGQWARFTAMVQDVWDTEWFVASSPEGQSALLTENAVASSHDAAVLAERLPVYLVSVPGETDWARGSDCLPAVPSVSASASATKLKRKRDETDNIESTVADENIDLNEGKVQATVSSARPPRPNDTLKRSKAGVEADAFDQPLLSGSAAANVIGLNSPDVGAASATAVVAKLYCVGYDGFSGAPPINSVIEVVGVVQDGLDVGSAADDAFAAEIIARNPRNVRRLHVVSWRTVTACEANPLVAELGVHAIPSARMDAASAAHHMRPQLIQFLASAMMGDLLAAEYVLLALLARPVRTGAQLLGKLSVNVVFPENVGTEVPSRFVRALRYLCPRVVVVDVSIASLNSSDVYPRKDYELNRLKAGRLQIAPGTCLVTDESRLTNGQLAERGMKNLRALASVVQRATAPLDFQYYESQMEVHCCTVMISRGGKSIINGDVVVRVHENKEVSYPNWESTDRDIVRKMRLALTLLAENGEFDITQEASDDVATAYVEARKQGRAKDGQESLQRWLNVARCSARSFGQNKLSLELWKYAIGLERAREDRITNTKT